MKSTKATVLKYPIGEFSKPETITHDHLKGWIKSIENFSSIIKSLTNDLSPLQLNWRYRPGGWTIKQVVHHCADSHINSLCRFKLALTEDNPTIRPYHEDRWAELEDSLSDDISDALLLLTALHSKWVYLLKSLNEEDLNKKFVHPENGNQVSLAENIGIYAWHGEHHLAHIKQALASKGRYSLRD